MNISNMNLGEKIETIVENRSTGKMGEWLGCSADTFGLCLVDDVIYRVKRNNDVDADYFWTVQDLETLNIVYCKDKYSLPMIKIEHFAQDNTVIN